MDYLVIELTSLHPEVGLYRNERDAQGAAMVHLINDPRDLHPVYIDEDDKVGPDLVVYRIDLDTLAIELDSKFTVRIQGC